MEIDVHGISSIVIVGDFGSGKTEVAVNLCLQFASSEPRRPLAIADLDLVNPYFRCREARLPLEEAGVRVVMPSGGEQFADLPILLPEVRGLLQDRGTLSVLDVGGDAAGARVLASLASSFSPAGHVLWLVVNASRPFNDTRAGCLRTIRRIEDSTGLKVTGLISNTHLMGETTPAMVMAGLVLAKEVASELGIRVELLAAMEPIAQSFAQPLAQFVNQYKVDCPLLSMKRIMVPPWLRRQAGTPSRPPLGTIL
ncbi:MAG: cobalamin biosynthesis protein CbiA [Pseudomonadota bacterium]